MSLLIPFHGVNMENTKGLALVEMEDGKENIILNTII
jgi:hypothetical protein